MDACGSDPGRGKKTERFRECSRWCLRDGFAADGAPAPESGNECEACICEGNAWRVGEEIDPFGGKEDARGEWTDGEKDVDEIDRVREWLPGPG